MFEYIIAATTHWHRINEKWIYFKWKLISLEIKLPYFL